MHSREYIEELTLRYLTVQRPGDLPDWMIESQFKQLIPVFEVAIAKILDNNTVPLFTDDDLASFMLLKAHLLLRRQQYDFERNPYSFFYTSFKHLIYNIVRNQRTLKCQAMRWDVLDIVDPLPFHDEVFVSEHQEDLLIHLDQSLSVY